MSIKNQIIDDIILVPMKIILLGIGFYYASLYIDSLLINLDKNDDAWVPDAMMLLAIGIYMYCVFVGKAKKHTPTMLTSPWPMLFTGRG